MLKLSKKLIDKHVKHKDSREGSIFRTFISEEEKLNILVRFRTGDFFTFSLPEAIDNGTITIYDEYDNILFGSDKIKQNDNRMYFPDIANIDLQKELAIFSIFDWYEDKEIYEFLKKDVMSIISKDYKGGSISEIERNHLMIVLAWIAFDHYDGQFWPPVREEFASSYRYPHVETNVDKTIRERISEQEKYQDSRHITSVLVHTAVPKNFLSGFFELAYDIYDLNFDFYLDRDDIDDILDHCIAGLVRLMDKSNQDNDNLNLSTTRKSYLLIKSTKLAFKHYSKSMANYLKLILGLIDIWYYKKVVTDKYPKILIDEFAKWSADKVPQITARKDSERIGRPEYGFNSGSKTFYLSFPTYILKNIDSPVPGKLNIVLTIDGNSFQMDASKFRIEEKIGYNIVKIAKYEFTSFPRNLAMEISYDDTVIVRSSDIVRNFIIFSGDGKELRNYREHNEIVYIVFPASSEFSMHENVNLVLANEHYKIVAFEPEKDKIYKCDVEHIYFSELLKAGIYGKYKDNIKAFENDKEIRVFNLLDSYVFETKYEPNDLVLKINSKEYELSDLPIEKNKYNLYFNYKIDLHPITINNNLTSISVLHKSSGQRVGEQQRVILDENLEVIMEETSNPLKKDILLISSFSEEPVVHEEFDFAKNKVLCHKFALGGNEVRYEFNPPIKRYKLDENSDWEILSDIELKNHRNVYFSHDINKINLYSKHRKKLPLTHLTKTSEELYFNFGVLEQFKEEHDYIYIDLVTESAVISNIKVYLNSYVLSHNFIPQGNDRVLATFDIKNFALNTLKLLVQKDNRKIKEIYLSSAEAYITHLEPFQNYTVQIIKEKTSILSTSTYRNIYETNLYFRDFTKLAGKSFFVDKIFYYSYASGKLFDGEMDYKSVIVQIIERIHVPPHEHINFNYEKGLVYRCRLRKINASRITSRFHYLDEVYIEINSDITSPNVSFEIVDKDGGSLRLSKRNIRFLIDNQTEDSDYSVDYMVMNVDEGEFR